MKREENRKIAANYIYLPGYKLVKNGYVLYKEAENLQIVEMGELRDIAGLEFYGGMIVADYVCGYAGKFVAGNAMITDLNRIYADKGNTGFSLAIIEGADLKNLVWTKETRIRKL